MWKAALLRAVVPLASRQPAPFYGIAWLVGWAAWRVRRNVRARVERNLLPAFDGDRRLARRASLEVFRNVTRYYVDMASLPGRDLANLEADALDIVHAERLALLQERRPVMIVSAHMGNPEVAIQALAARGRPFTALVEPLEGDSYAKTLLQIRRSGGGRFYEADFTGVRAALRDLRAGAVLAVLGDRDIQRNGVCVPFLGSHVKMPRGLWEIARRERALVLPIFSLRRDGIRLQLHVEEPFEMERSDDLERDVCKAASKWAKLFEEHVRREPGQWTVLEDFWTVHACDSPANL